MTRGDPSDVRLLYASITCGKDRGVLLVDIRRVPKHDVALIEELARVQLSLRRRGGVLYLTGAPAGFCELLRFLGLDDVLPLHD